MKNWIEFLKKNIWFAVVVAILAPFVITIIFSTCYADDFDMAIHLVSNPFENFFVSIKMTNAFYKNWAGEWPIIFLQYFINPLAYFKAYSHAVGIELEIFFCALMFSIYIYLRAVLKYFFRIRENKIWHITYILFIVIALNTEIYSEIYYWFVGNQYLWELVFSLFNQVLILKFFRKDDCSTKSGIILALFGFVACFGYQLAVMSGIIYLIELWTMWSDKNKVTIKKVYPLIFMILGGCISCFSPGNFSRHSAIDSSGLHLSSAIINGFKNCVVTHYVLFQSPVFIIFMLMIGIVGYRYIKEENVAKIHPIVMFILQIINVFCVCFPIALGYSNANLPNRMYFMINMTICLWMVINMLHLGGWIRLKTNGQYASDKNINWMICILSVILLMALLPDYSGKGNLLGKTPWIYTASNIGDVIKDGRTNRSILREIEESPNGEVVVVREDGDANLRTGIILPLNLGEDKEYWVNYYTAKYFGKESVILYNIENEY